MGGFFLENYSRPPMRAEGTHRRTNGVSNTLRLHLAKFDWWTSLRTPLTFTFANVFAQPVVVKAKLGYKELRMVKSTTVHQEFRVLRRMLNVAVRKKLLARIPVLVLSFRLP